MSAKVHWKLVEELDRVKRSSELCQMFACVEGVMLD